MPSANVIEYQGSKCRVVLDLNGMKLELWKRYQLIADSRAVEETLDFEEADELALECLNELTKFCIKASIEARERAVDRYRRRMQWSPCRPLLFNLSGSADATATATATASA